MPVLVEYVLPDSVLRILVPGAPKSIVVSPYAAPLFFKSFLVVFVTAIIKSLGHAVGTSPTTSIFQLAFAVAAQLSTP